MSCFLRTFALCSALTLSLAAPAPAPALAPAARIPAEVGKRITSNYQPIDTTCPATSLVRAADGISTAEQAYITARKAVADKALAAWLLKQSSAFDTSSLPTVGLTTSGGGYRSLLVGAGFYQGLDSRDTDETTGGLVQSLTYQAGLSGGSWFLSSLAGNNWPTVSYLKANLWEDAFDNSLLVPANIFSIDGLTQYAVIVGELSAKEEAGYDTTLVDPYGRLLSYQLLEGTHGGSSVRLSGLADLGNFKSYNVPYPIITTIGVPAATGECWPDLDAPIYEFHPYEYGSWDTGIAAFTDSLYMGSSLNAGVPAGDSCTAQYDNLGYILGTSSNLFNALCSIIDSVNSTTDLSETLEGMIPHDSVFNDLFGIYPNPFYKFEQSSSVVNDKYLTLADGGETNQNNPIWPFIQNGGRSVDVLIVNDNSADTDDNFPNGTEILTTYQRAQEVGLTKMPYIPSVDTFVSQGLNKRATFFGCDEPETTLMVFVPNVDYTFASNTATSKLSYSADETNAMIANGLQVATQGGEEGWPLCLACAVMSRGGDLPVDPLIVISMALRQSTLRRRTQREMRNTQRKAIPAWSLRRRCK
ncbi:lysophospholipase catalytic domain-containing protein [Pseudomassariella vexata]|uniref:Lysophospholipase n=1 Tax=Pseudomassariella vexata TaxID=1141098 RepID=A0A1Y2DQK5_9PEZI|nr:lysophospholipase catalytic domain-containing protein [Pseudomassariella vexata]ORY61540.1 lysophospholipase catalytic domain-domain-containing protein [Pseudomassariella vexata]